MTPINAIARLGRGAANARARAYLEREGVLRSLIAGQNAEIGLRLVDLANLHRLVRVRRPSVVLEFGVGFSTIAIAHALWRNAAEPRRPSRDRAEPIDRPRLWSVDASADWLENTRQKLGPELAPFVEMRHSPVRATEYDGQLCAVYDRLPDIVPDFVYLDAPAYADIQGNVRGLSFTPETGGYRHPVAADVLLMESTLQVGFFMLLDSRYVNAHFLIHNLRRQYRMRWNRVHGWVTFELLEWTGRSRSNRPARDKKR